MLLSSSETALFVNGVQIPGSKGFGTHELWPNSANTMAKTVVGDLTAGSVITVRSRRIAGLANIETRPNGSNLLIERR